MSKLRGFEAVKPEHIQNFSKTITEETPTKIVANGEVRWIGEVKLPIRADKRSAGYDFFAPRDIELLPAQKLVVYSDVKAYMKEDEVLKLYPRSSMGIKQGLMISCTVGIIDSSYYENPDNDGNIGLALLNTSGRAIHIKRGERIVQGIFAEYLVADNDAVLQEERTGGVGHSGK